MLPILLVLGATGALLEIQRLVNRPPQDVDALRLKKSEERLKRVLQEVQQELQRARNEQQRDQQRADELEKTAQDLRRAGEELKQHSAQLQHKAIGLETEKNQLKTEVRELHGQHEAQLKEEAAKHEIQLDQLKNGIASLLEDFSTGKLSSIDLKESLETMGVDVQFSAEELTKALPAPDSEIQENPKTLELKVDTEFKSQLRLVSECPERLAKLVARSQRPVGLLQAGPSGKAFPIVRTPPGIHKEVSVFSSRSRGLTSAGSSEDKENQARPALATVTASVPEPPKPSGRQEIVKGASGGPRRNNAIPKMTIAKSVKKAANTLPGREAFALTDLAVDNDQSPVMRHAALRF